MPSKCIHEASYNMPVLKKIIFVSIFKTDENFIECFIIIIICYIIRLRLHSEFILIGNTDSNYVKLDRGVTESFCCINFCYVRECYQRASYT